MEDNRKTARRATDGVQLPPTAKRLEEERARLRESSAGLRMPGSDVKASDEAKQRMERLEQNTRTKMQQSKREEYDNMKANRQTSKKARKKKMKRLWSILGVEILTFFVLLIGYGIFYANSKLDSLNYNEISDEDLGINEGLSDLPKEKFTTVALFGIDARDVNTDAGNRSDTIMIASVNNETKEVRIVSVFRDTYLEVENPAGRGDDLFTKVTHTYAYGGPKAAVATLNKNLDLQITEYVTVNFQSLTDAINDLGGITVEVDEDERYAVNLYLPETAEVAGMQYTPLTQTGMVNLDGLQATTYCRIRYEVAGGDVGRAERQREVLQAILDKAKQSDLATLNDILDDVLPKVSTSLSKKELLSLMTGVFDYKIVANEGFPFIYHIDSIYDETLDTNLSMVVTGNLENNVALLHEFLYDATIDFPAGNDGTDGTTDSTEPPVASGDEVIYTPSSEVLRISEEIETKTGIYPPDDPEFRGQY